jgi:tight adherence protein C
MTLSVETMLPYLVFLSITLGTWGMLTVIADQAANADDRLRRIMNPAQDRQALEQSVARRQDKFQAQVTKAARKLGQSLRPSDEQELGKVRHKLLNAGFRHEQAVAVYFGVKVIALLIGLVVAFPVMALKLGMTRNAFTVTAVIGESVFTCPISSSDPARKKGPSRFFSACPTPWT